MANAKKDRPKWREIEKKAEDEVAKLKKMIIPGTAISESLRDSICKAKKDEMDARCHINAIVWFFH